MAQPYGYYDESRRMYFVVGQDGQARPATRNEAAQIQGSGGSYMFPTYQQRDQQALAAGVGYGYYDESSQRYFVVGQDGEARPASPVEQQAIVESGGSWTPDPRYAQQPAAAPAPVPQTAQQQQQASNDAAWQRYTTGQGPAPEINWGGAGYPGATNPQPMQQAVAQAQTGGPDSGIGGWDTSSVRGADWWKEYANPAVPGGNQTFRGATDLADAYYTNNDPAALWWQYAESQGHGDQFNRYVANNFERYQSRFKQLAENNPSMQLRDFMTGGLGRQLYNEFNLQAPQARGLDSRLTNPGRFGTGGF